MDGAILKQAWGAGRLAVLGLGLSGLAVARACRAADIDVTVWDDNPQARAAAVAEGFSVADFSVIDLSGYAALCAGPGVPLTHPVPHPVVARALAAGVAVLGDVELFARAHPQAMTIGITGTNGKSTTTALVAHLLQAAGRGAVACGNIGAPVFALGDTLPADTVYVMELSSFQIDLCPVFRPQIAALTNFGPNHIDRHGGMAGYIAAKRRMFEGAGVAVIGVDDAAAQAFCADVRRAGLRDVVTASCHDPAADIYVTAQGVLHDHGVAVADMRDCAALRGVHNWQNAALAYGLCRAAGVAGADIAAALRGFGGLDHRQKEIARYGDVVYINDSKATNDVAAARALASFDNIFWIAGGKSKGGGYQACAAHLPAVRHAFLIGDAAEEMAAWLAQNGVSCTISETLARAVQTAHVAAQACGASATVLLSPACASYDQFANFEDRGNAFAAAVKALGGGHE